jgi:hypothetical protein
MPVVDIKGVGKAQFPDDMMTNDIRSFLRQKYSPELSRQDALTPRPATMQASNPSLATRAGTAIGEGLNSSGIISDRFGAQQIGKNVTSIGEFLPGIGDAAAGDEFGRALKQGDNFGMAMGALGAIPLVGDAAKKGVKTFYHGTNNNFTEFDKKKIGSSSDPGIRGRGFYFSPDAKTASSYGDNLKSVELKYNNPIDLQSFNSAEDLAEYLDFPAKEIKFRVDQLPSGLFKSVSTKPDMSGQFTSAIKEKGHDAIIHGKETIVFEPSQIKTLSTDKAMSVGGEVTSKFNPKLIDTNEGFLIRTDNGKLDGVSSGSDFMVKNSLIDKDRRGKGEGVELYVNAIEEARKKGFKRFVSDDDTVDAPAIRIYEALERRGYKVDKHPDFRLVTELEGSDFAHAGDNSAFSIDLSKQPAL